MSLDIAAVHNEIIYFLHASNFAHTAPRFTLSLTIPLFSLPLFPPPPPYLFGSNMRVRLRQAVPRLWSKRI